MVGRADDLAEHQADQVADTVLQRLRAPDTGPPDPPDSGPPDPGPSDATVLRVAAPEVGAEGGGLSPDASAAIESRRGAGRPMERGLRNRMEGAFGADLGGVRIHVGPEAEALNRSLSARAFTTGSDVFFGDGAYRPGTGEGDHILAHELAHTLQQGTGARRLIRRLKDYRTAPDINSGTGLTKSYPSRHGPMHFHVIPDDQRLGLIERIFLKFEERKQGSQHLQVDEDGRRVDTNLWRTGSEELIRFGMNQLYDYYDDCATVSRDEIADRKIKQQELSRRQDEENRRLGPVKEAGKFDYGATKQAGLYGATSSPAEESAIERLAKAGISKTHPDFVSLKRNVAAGKPKEEWPAYIQPLYDKIFEKGA